MDRKEKKEFYIQKNKEWINFRSNIIYNIQNNPETLAGGKSLSYWDEESNRQLEIINKHLKKIEITEKAVKAAPYAIIMIAIIAIFALRPQITGFVVKTEASGPGAEFTDIINVSYTHSNQYNWIPENLGNISYIKLSGWFAGNGSVQVYAISGNESYLVLNYTGINSSSQNISAMLLENVKKQDAAENENTTMVLSYNSGTIFDPDDNGITTEDNVVDFNINGTSYHINSTNATEDGLCTRWQIENLDAKESSYECYGASKCCNFLGFISGNEMWNATYYVFKGKDSAGNNNIVRAQTVYIGKNISEIFLANWTELPAIFVPEMRYNFENACKDTCNVSLNSSEYFFKIDLEDAKITLSNATYFVEGANASTENTANFTMPVPICECPGRGNWVLSGNDSCIIRTDCDLGGGNLEIRGNVTFIVENAMITNVSNVTLSNGAKLIKMKGGKIEKKTD